MSKIGSIVAGGIIALLTAASANAAQFNFSATGPWADPFDPTLTENPAGTITGLFEASDVDANGFLDLLEVTSWSMTTSGFNLSALNFTASSATGGVLSAVDNGGTTNEIAAGLAVGVMTFANDTGDALVQLDLQVPFGNFFGANIFSFSDPVFGLYTTENLTINGQTFPNDPTTPIPLPATLPLLLAGLGIFGIARRRRNS